MKQSTMFGWCLVALLAGVGYVILGHVTLVSVLIFVGLPLALIGCVLRFGPTSAETRR